MPYGLSFVPLHVLETRDISTRSSPIISIGATTLVMETK